MQERDQRDTTVLRKSPTVFTSVLKRKLAPDAFTSEQLRKSKCYQRYIGVVYIKSSKDVVWCRMDVVSRHIQSCWSAVTAAEKVTWKHTHLPRLLCEGKKKKKKEKKRRKKKTQCATGSQCTSDVGGKRPKCTKWMSESERLSWHLNVNAHLPHVYLASKNSSIYSHNSLHISTFTSQDISLSLKQTNPRRSPPQKLSPPPTPLPSSTTSPSLSPSFRLLHSSHVSHAPAEFLRKRRLCRDAFKNSLPVVLFITFRLYYVKDNPHGQLLQREYGGGGEGVLAMGAHKRWARRSLLLITSSPCQRDS